MARLILDQADDHIDLVPLIDCIFLLLLFFMLVGRLSDESRPEQITVPPTKTANALSGATTGWQREIIQVSGSTVGGDPPRNTLRLGTRTMVSQGLNDFAGYQQVRAILDQIYERAEKYPDPRGSGQMLPKVVVEIRADANAEYRVVQELQQVLCDGLDLATMKPRAHGGARPFVTLDFTTRPVPGL